MQKLFTRYITLVIVLSSFLILGFTWFIQEYNAKSNIQQNAELKLEQIVTTLNSNKDELDNLTDSLNEDYLTRAYAFAYIIRSNPDVLSSQSELEKIKDLLRVDELHVIDEDGILFAGTIPKYFGLDFQTTKQTKEFLPILEDNGYLIQDIQPNGAEKKVFQYIGVARQDKKGIVQIGLAPTRILEARQKNEISYIISRLPMDEGISLFAVNKETGQILAHSDDTYLDKNVDDLGVDLSTLIHLSNGNFIQLTDSSVYCVSKVYDQMLLCIAYDRSVVFQDQNMIMFTTVIGLVLIAIIMILTLRYLLKRQIVTNLHRIVEDVRKISNGNLDTVVHVENIPEFKQLSGDINKMVASILNATVKVSKVIDIVDMPIGVFEFRHDQKDVMATDRLRFIMDWDKEKADLLYQDKDAFMKEMGKVMNPNKTNVTNIYHLHRDPDKWIQVYMAIDENGTFGVVSDVTSDVKEKKKIEYERDHDALTKLNNIKSFHIKVDSLLKQVQRKTAAIVMLDLDDFKSINDQYGHDWGDTYLKVFAALLSEFENDQIICARRSGDEFCIFLYHFDSKEDIRKVLNSYYQKISAYRLRFPDQKIHHIQLSAGLAWVEDTLQSYEDLMHAADIALYASKHHGKGILSEYEKDLQYPDIE